MTGGKIYVWGWVKTYYYHIWWHNNALAMHSRVAVIAIWDQQLEWCDLMSVMVTFSPCEKGGSFEIGHTEILPLAAFQKISRSESRVLVGMGDTTNKQLVSKCVDGTWR